MSRLAEWINEDGLLVEEAIEVMRRLKRPEAVSGFDHGGKVLAALALEVGEVLKARRGREKQQQFREESERAAQNAAGPSVIRDILAERLKVPT